MNYGKKKQSDSADSGNKIFTKRSYVKRYLAAAVAVLVVAAVVVVYIYLSDNRMHNFDKEYTLFVYPEMTSSQVIDSIKVHAQARRPRSLDRCASKEDLTTRLKPGKYKIKPSFTSIYTVRMLCNGWQVTHNLTLSGTIRTKGRLAQKIGSQMMTDSTTVDSLLNDTTFLVGLGFTPENVFALFLPDTYEVYWTESAEDIFKRFKREYDRFWTPERIEKAAAQKLTPMETSVLASIVNGETLQSFEYPIIAKVYLNRLHSGMKLQADPTVAYCFNYELDRILKKHTQVDSPYNTYKYYGLPPAPINVPPKGCIEAVLNPDDNKYIYFCASPDFNGTHRFAVSYSEHLRNAREFHRALTKRRAEAAAAQK